LIIIQENTRNVSGKKITLMEEKNLPKGWLAERTKDRNRGNLETDLNMGKRKTKP